MTAERLSQGYYQASGTVLLRNDIFKGGRSLLLFTRGFGPRWTGAPASGGKNRFGGAAEPMVWGSFSLYQSPSRLYLHSVEVKDDFLALRASRSALSCAARLYRLTANEAPLDCENDALLRALWNAMLQLREKTPARAVEFRYMWKFLAVMGAAPSLAACAGCGERLTDGGLFTNEGILCGRCGRHAEGSLLSKRERLLLLACAALPRDRFIKWAAAVESEEIFAANIKKLSAYFRNLR